MKNLYTLILLLVAINLFAQSPEKMSYQAVIRNSNNELVQNNTIGMKISILQGSVSGEAVYIETHTSNTNINGLVSIEIGSGTVLFGEFSEINWANGPYFIKTETDADGGEDYTIIGTSQILSVAYALHSKTADSLTGNLKETDPFFLNSVAASITSDNIDFWNNKQNKMFAGNLINIINDTINYIGNNNNSNPFYLGQDTLGGIVFYVYLGSDGRQHGLIASKTETTAAWQIVDSLLYANSTWDGEYNTNFMINSPAKDWVQSLGDGWYIPAIDELNLLISNRFHVNNTLQKRGYSILNSGYTYWSSTEDNVNPTNNAWGFYNNITARTKSQSHKVRGVKAF